MIYPMEGWHDYGNSNDLIKQIRKLPLHQQQHIYSFLEEVFVLG